jgi:hypothetical protein
MTWIKDFISKKCPLCDSSLNFNFVSTSRKEIKTIDDQLLINFKTGYFPDQGNYLQLSINYENLDFEINSFIKDKKELKISIDNDLDYCKRIFLYPENGGVFNGRFKPWKLFSGSCKCLSYYIESSTLSFCSKTGKVESSLLPTLSEVFSLSTSKTNYKLINNYKNNNSELIYQGADLLDCLKVENLPILTFEDKNDLIKRLETITVFS